MIGVLDPHRLFAALPGLATVPVCCGAPVAAVAGGVTVGALYRWTPVLMGSSLILLSANVFVLGRKVRMTGAPVHEPAMVAHEGRSQPSGPMGATP